MPFPEKIPEPLEQQIYTEVDGFRKIGEAIAEVLENNPGTNYQLEACRRNLDADDLERLQQRLTPSSPILLYNKLEAILDTMPALSPKEAAVQFMAAQLVNIGGRGFPKGAGVKSDAQTLVVQILHDAKLIREKQQTEVEPEEKKQLLSLPDLLSKLMDECEVFAGGFDPFSQLMDPVATTGRGICVSHIQSVEPIVNIFEALRALRLPQARPIFIGWIRDTLSAQKYPSFVVAAGLLAQTTFLLDEASIFRLWGKNGATEDIDDFLKHLDKTEAVIPYAPFFTLDIGFQSAIEIMKSSPNGMNYVQSMKGVQRLLRTRYSQILSVLPKLEQTDEGSGRIPLPHPEQMATLFYDQLGTRIKRGSLPPWEAAHYIIVYLKQMRVDRKFTQDFCRALGKSDQAFAQKVREEAVEAGLLPDKNHNLARRRLSEIKKTPWVDAADLDPELIAPRGIHTVIVDVLSCTLGPCHDGHIEAVLSDLAHVDYSELTDLEQDAAGLIDAEGIRRVVLILPITTPKQLKTWHKKSYIAGPLSARIASLLVQLPPQLDRSKVLISTKLQISPSQAETVENAIQAAVNQLAAIVNEKLRDRRNTTPRFVIRGVVGADELAREKRGGELIVRALPHQPRKYKQIEEWVVLGRHGYLDFLVRNFGRMKLHVRPKTNLVLKPGLPNKSSTAARERINQGNFRDFRTLGRLFARYWTKKEIENRRLGQPTLPDLETEEGAVPSVTEICQWAILQAEEQLSQRT